ncbi:MFS transporter [Amycolatopsis sp. NPDC005232]|uniref:MFS transporter n=1 Tax=Amycolatopsis sp. NPDC005232 TaxID=3157027 RepID=UPI0033A064AA
MNIDVSGTAALDVAGRLDRLPITRWQLTVRLVIGVVTFFDAFDQLLISYVLPVLSHEWQLSAAGSTWAITAGSVGMLGGALVSGYLADRFGRVRVIVVSLCVYGFASLLLAAAPSFELFVLLRVVQGLGIGGEVPVAATYIGEIANARHRGRFVLLYEVIFPLGLAAASLTAVWVVPTFGWRWLFVIGALPLPAVYFIRKLVPESPRWLAARGYADRARQTVERIEAKIEAITGEPLPRPEPAGVDAVDAKTRGSWRELFTGRYRRRTFVLWCLWFCAYFVVYGIASWLPSIYSGVFHLPLRQALTYSMAGTVAGLLGSVLIALTVDRLGRRRALTAASGFAGVLLLALWILGAGSAAQIMVWSSLAAVFGYAVSGGLYLMTPELYPTRIRALGCSLAGVWNRLGVIIGPVVIGAVYAGGDLAAVFLVLGAVALIAAIVTGLFAEETARRPLEEVSP